jgi:hypothetical protein
MDERSSVTTASYRIRFLAQIFAYLRFVESGETLKKIPDAEGPSLILSLIGKFSLRQKAASLFRKARAALEGAGLRLQFSVTRPN